MQNFNRIISPINIVTVFAALSEASAATTLPYLDEDSRKLYVWFLVLFPCALVLMFFFTVNFNRSALSGAAQHKRNDNCLKSSRAVHIGLLSTHIDAVQLTTLLNSKSSMTQSPREFEFFFVQRT